MFTLVQLENVTDLKDDAGIEPKCLLIMSISLCLFDAKVRSQPQVTKCSFNNPEKKRIIHLSGDKKK